MKSYLTILLLALVTHTCFTQSALNVSKLHDDLMTLNPNIRPVSDITKPTVVSISFHLITIISLETGSQKLVSNGWWNVTWKIDYMTWDPEAYEGIRSITVSTEHMWRPQLTVKNTLQNLKPISEGYKIMSLESNGVVSWYPGENFETFCHVDVTFFPFDHQRCRWQLNSWGQTNNVVVLRPVMDSIDMDSYQRNEEWDLISSKAWVQNYSYETTLVSLLYYEVTLRRRPTLLMFTVLLPVMVLAHVNVFVFTIPSEAGERLAYSMTSYLTFGVFMGFIMGLIPSSSDHVSILAVCLSGQMISSALAVLLCILSLRLFHRDSDKYPVPARLQTITVFMENMFCLDPPSQCLNSLSQPQTEGSSTDGSDDFHGINEKGNQPTKVKGGRLRNQLDRWVMKRQAKQEAFRQPQDMTWQRVSRTLDKVLFRLFFGLVMMTQVVFIIIAVCIYE